MSKRSMRLASALGFSGAGFAGIAGAQAQSGDAVGNTVKAVAATGSCIGDSVRTNALPVGVLSAEDLRRRGSPNLIAPFARLSNNHDPFTASSAGRVVKLALSKRY